MVALNIAVNLKSLHSLNFGELAYATRQKRYDYVTSTVPNRQI